MPCLSSPAAPAVGLEELVDGRVIVGEQWGVVDPGREVVACGDSPAGLPGVQCLLHRAQVDRPVGGDHHQVAPLGGDARVEADVTGFTEKGNVLDVAIVSSNPPRVFDREVIEALSQWKCTAEGQRYVGNVEVNFSLKDE